ncbi:hypothetical protein GQX73_g2902 [Xylaria multiplex]|uniref:WSC domain-containing protein n=1 Tax=Xylaria multiplex TaxID=323545 RepID=A0A7C8IWA6_9PEZI|nr:hypothetical protein GQX73_g2902 [Xylaria multiplex]
MLTKIIIAGLIPGMMAKPIVSRPGTSAAVHNSTGTSSAMASWSHTAKVVFSTATPKKEKKVENDLVKAEVDAVERRQPVQAGSYPVYALPSVPVVALPSIAPSVSTAALPALSSPVLPSVAVDTPAVLPPLHYPVVKPPPAVSSISSPIAQVQYGVKTPVVQVDTTSVPTVIQTFPVQAPYGVKTPAIQVVPTPISSAVSSFPVLPYSIKTPAVQPVIPTYPVVAPPVQAATSLATSVQLPYSVKTPAVLPELPKATYPVVPSVVSTPIVQVPSVVPTTLVQVPYGVKPSTPVSSVVQLPYDIKPSTPVSSIVQVPYDIKPSAPVSTIVQLPYDIKPSTPVSSIVQLPYDIKPSAPVSSIVQLPYDAKSSAHASTLVQAPYGANTHTVTSIKASAAPSVVPGTHVPTTGADSNYPAGSGSGSGSPGGSGSSACAHECDIKCQTAHIAMDVTQCRSSCLTACASSSANGVFVGTPDSRKDKAKSKGAAGVPGVPAIPGVPGLGAPGVGVGSVSYEACMQSCNGRWQHADIAGDVSTGRENCKAACAGYSSSGTSVVIPRKFKDLVPSEPVVGAGASTYEACMRGCVAKWQGAGVGCQDRCAASTGFGASVIIKKDVEESAEESVEESIEESAGEATEEIVEEKRDIKDLIPGGPIAGAGKITYESCMSSCNGRWQHADIAGDMSTGREHCTAACAKYAAKGAGVIVKKALPEAKPFPPFNPSSPIVGVGSTSYDACLKDCSSKFQSAHIAMDNSQGKYSCKQACAHLEGHGAGVIVKKDTSHQVEERQIASPSLPKPSLPLPTSKLPIPTPTLPPLPDFPPLPTLPIPTPDLP